MLFRSTPVALTSDVAMQKGPVVIAAHRETVPDLVKAFGGEPPRSVKGYGAVWVIGDGKTQVVQLDADAPGVPAGQGCRDWAE